MADYKVTDTELTSIANAIRTKGGTSAQLEFPTDFVSAVNAIPTGGGGAYSFCKGIHFDGASYIDTGIAPQSNTSVSVMYSFDDKNSNYFSYGARTQGGYDDFSSYYETSSVGDGEGIRVRINEALYANGSQSFGITDANAIIHVVANAVPQYATALGSVKSAPSSYRGCNKPIYLGGMNDNGVVGGPLKGVVYGFSIDRASVVQMNLVPCVRNADSKAGFYDTVSGQFYGNANSEGTLTPVT